MDLLAHSVDLLFPEEVNLLGNYGAALFERVFAVSRDNKIAERAAVLPLLLNALTTSVGAFELWRRGLLLQVGILLRAGFETVATASAITFDRSAHRRYVAGRYKSSAAL